MTATTVDGVLIVGGGYAGVHAARAIRGAGGHASVLDPTGRHDFVTRLAAVAGGTAPRSDASAPLSDFADQVIVGSMTSVDDGTVVLDDGSSLSADAVIITAGARPVRPPIDGLDHAWTLRTEKDALALRDEIAASSSVVIVGGGATGVQLAGAIAHRHPSTDVTVIDAADTLLDGMGEATRADAERILRDRGVDIHLEHDVESVGPMSVTAGGTTFEGLPVWAAGFSARADEFGLPVDDQGRVETDQFLRVRGRSSTFAAGDIAVHVDPRGDELPMSAQIAVQAGEAAGDNAMRLVAGRRLRSAQLRHRGWVLDLGGYRGLAEIGPLTLSKPVLDLAPPLLHWAIDVRHLVETRGLDGLADRPGG